MLTDRLIQLKQRFYYKFLTEFIFVHINKSGGSSIETALNIPFAHKTALEFQAITGAKRWDKLFTFTFVRNPWDKVVSHYHYRVMTNQTDLGSRPLDFPDWVRLSYGQQDPRYYDKPKMFMPQTQWICDANGKVIVDFIGKFEHLSDDFAAVCKTIGRPEVQLPHLKQSKRASYRDYYTGESKDIVAKWFASDIELFEYRF